MFSQETRNAIAAAAMKAGIEPAAVLAVAEIESAGKAFATVAGRQEPLIRFEGHYFDRRLSSAERARARAEGLSAPEAGAIANPASQAARWTLLARAAAINRKAAHESVSWGLGQVMGAHWAWLGYPNVDALVEEARASVEGQTRLMLRYIDRSGLRDALARRDWAAFAKGYNGPGYRKNRYDTKLAAAYARHAAAAPAGSAPAPWRGLLRAGMRGDAVRRLQEILRLAGHQVVVDGAFGGETEAAVRAFQAEAGLAVDGVAGPATLAALERRNGEASSGGPWQMLVAWIASLFGPR